MSRAAGPIMDHRLMIAEKYIGPKARNGDTHLFTGLGVLRGTPYGVSAYASSAKKCPSRCSPPFRFASQRPIYSFCGCRGIEPRIMGLLAGETFRTYEVQPFGSTPCLASFLGGLATSSTGGTRFPVYPALGLPICLSASTPFRHTRA